MAHLVDSSVWVALFLEKDSQHAKAAKAIERQKGVLYVPYCVVNETATVLAYKHSKKQADYFLAFIEQNKDIVLLDDVLAEELHYYPSISSRISFTDAALLFLQKKLKVKVITFDKQLERLASKSQ